MRTLKEKLKEAGRLDGVVEILTKIIKEQHNDMPPVGTYVKDGKIEHCISGEDLVLEASKFLFTLFNETIDDREMEEFPNLERYIGSITDALLYSYAVSISHRNEHDEKLMDKIRTYLIISNYLRCMNIDRDSDPVMKGSEWEIPDGWRNTGK